MRKNDECYACYSGIEVVEPPDESVIVTLIEDNDPESWVVKLDYGVSAGYIAMRGDSDHVREHLPEWDLDFAGLG